MSDEDDASQDSGKGASEPVQKGKDGKDQTGEDSNEDEDEEPAEEKQQSADEDEEPVAKERCRPVALNAAEQLRVDYRLRDQIADLKKKLAESEQAQFVMTEAAKGAATSRATVVG